MPRSTSRSLRPKRLTSVRLPLNGQCGVTCHIVRRLLSPARSMPFTRRPQTFGAVVSPSSPASNSQSRRPRLSCKRSWIGLMFGSNLWLCWRTRSARLREESPLQLRVSKAEHERMLAHVHDEKEKAIKLLRKRSTSSASPISSRLHGQQINLWKCEKPASRARPRSSERHLNVPPRTCRPSRGAASVTRVGCSMTSDEVLAFYDQLRDVLYADARKRATARRLHRRRSRRAGAG